MRLLCRRVVTAILRASTVAGARAPVQSRQPFVKRFAQSPSSTGHSDVLSRRSRWFRASLTLEVRSIRFVLCLSLTNTRLTPGLLPYRNAESCCGRRLGPWAMGTNKIVSVLSIGSASVRLLPRLRSCDLPCRTTELRPLGSANLVAAVFTLCWCPRAAPFIFTTRQDGRRGKVTHNTTSVENVGDSE